MSDSRVLSAARLSEIRERAATTDEDATALAGVFAETDRVALLQHIDAMEKVLRGFQYYRDYSGDDEVKCQYCETKRGTPCGPDCALAALLGAGPTPGETK